MYVCRYIDIYLRHSIATGMASQVNELEIRPGRKCLGLIHLLSKQTKPSCCQASSIPVCKDTLCLRIFEAKHVDHIQPMLSNALHGKCIHASFTLASHSIALRTLCIFGWYHGFRAAQTPLQSATSSEQIRAAQTSYTPRVPSSHASTIPTVRTIPIAPSMPTTPHLPVLDLTILSNKPQLPECTS